MDGIHVKREVTRGNILDFAFSTKFTSNGALQTRDSQTIVFGMVPKQDQDTISIFLKSDFADISEVESELQAQSALAGTSLDPKIELLGDLPNAKTIRAINENSINGELPSFVLSSGGGSGVLAAWNDRLMIIKTGGLTGFMAGATGGGRSGTFYFKDINGIEFNSGFVNGVLEILTPSYTGTQTNDFWSSGKNDPWVLSNCLPIAKAQYEVFSEKINLLRNLISESKTQTIVVQAASGQISLSDELKKLVDLHGAGLISDDDLAAAKAKLLN
jgi:hypothetical protein